MKDVQTGNGHRDANRLVVTVVAIILLVLVVYVWASLWTGTSPVF
jgi:hypothetical protein